VRFLIPDHPISSLYSHLSSTLYYNHAIVLCFSWQTWRCGMSFTPKPLSQRDPGWINEKLGFDDSVTIGTDGCALTCLTMLVNGVGFNETPSSMNRKLKDMGTGIGFLGSLIVWPGLTRAFPKIIFRRIIVCRDQPAPLDEINASLDSGQPLVIELDRSPSAGLQNHWVVLYGRQGEDYLMLDPWPQPPDKESPTLVPRYGFGRPPSDFITAVVWYDAVPAAPPVPEAAPGTGLYVRVQAAASAGLRLRSGPATSNTAIAVESPGTLLHCLEPDAAAVPKIGVLNLWLQVRDPDGMEGYVAAWYVDQVGASVPAPEPTPGPVPLTVLVSQSIGTVGLRLRDQPATTSNTLSILPAGTELTPLEAADQVFAKVGQAEQWLNVRDGDGTSGYVAAWFVELKHTPSPTPSPQSLTVLVSSQASAGLRLRDRPSENGNILEILMPGTSLTVLEPAATAAAKIGVVNQWLNVKLAGGMTGYVAAWYVTR
jgi:SH3-like domain-containing protein